MPVAKVNEIVSSSTKSFDDAIIIGIAQAHKTIQNIKSAWVENLEVKLDDKGNILEYRVHLRPTFLFKE